MYIGKYGLATVIALSVNQQSYLSSNCDFKTNTSGHRKVPLRVLSTISIAFLILMYASTSTAALTVDGIEGVPCTEQDRLNGVGAMDIYVKGSGEEIACWRHRHPNGIDDIFIPDSWATTPVYIPRAIELISAAYRSVSKSRQSHGSLFGELRRPMSLLLAFDVRPGDADLATSSAALTGRVNPNRCLMIYRGVTPFSTSDLHGDTIEDFEFIVSHEVAHCIQYDRIPYSSTAPIWISESYANFMASLAYPSANTEHRHVATYDLDGRDFQQPYAGVILLEYALQTNDISHVVEYIKLLFEYNDIENQYGLVDDLLDFHAFATEHYQQKISDLGGCGGTSCSYPRESYISNVQNISVPEGESGSYSLPVPVVEGGRLNPVTLTVPPEFDVQFTGYSSSAQDLHSSTNISDSGTVSDSFNRWLDPVKLAGNCESTLTPQFLFTHMEVGNIDDVTINFELTKIDDCSEDEPEPETSSSSRSGSCDQSIDELPDLDQCLIGKWTPSREEMKTQFEQTVQQSIVSIEGSFAMELCQGGDGYFTVDKLAIHSGLTDAGSMIIGVDGAGNFRWSTAGDSFKTIMGDFIYDTSASMKIGDMSFVLPNIPFSNNMFPNGRLMGNYSCDESTLEFSGTEDGHMYKSWRKN